MNNNAKSYIDNGALKKYKAHSSINMLKFVYCVTINDALRKNLLQASASQIVPRKKKKRKTGSDVIFKTIDMPVNCDLPTSTYIAMRQPENRMSYFSNVIVKTKIFILLLHKLLYDCRILE